MRVLTARPSSALKFNRKYEKQEKKNEEDVRQGFMTSQIAVARPSLR